MGYRKSTGSFLLLFILIALAGCAPSSVSSPTPTNILTPPIPSFIPTEGNITMISGYVVDECVDLTPTGLVDAPRKFVCTVKTDVGSIVKVSYTAFPPSPAGDEMRKKIRLNFHAGHILKGDYIQAAGELDPATNTLVVFDEGHYIDTFATKP